MMSVSLKSLYGTAFFTNKNGVGRPRGYQEKVQFYLLHPDNKQILSFKYSIILYFKLHIKENFVQCICSHTTDILEIIDQCRPQILNCLNTSCCLELHHELKIKIWCLVVSIRSSNACNSKVVIFN